MGLKRRLIESAVRDLKIQSQALEAKGDKESLTRAQELFREQSALINQRNKSKPKSFATKAIAERIELFNRLYKQKILHNVTDQFDEHNYPSGTVIHIFIPRYEVDKYDL